MNDNDIYLRERIAMAIIAQDGMFHKRIAQDTYNWVMNIQGQEQQPPVDNDHVTEGHTPFTEEDIKANEDDAAKNSSPYADGVFYGV